jgi:cell division transport system permease protein
MIFRRDHFERLDLLPALRAWLRQHGYGMLYSVGSLIRYPVATALTCLVLALALALPLGLRVSLLNLSHLGGDWQGLERVTVFLNVDVSAESARHFSDTMLEWPEVASTQLVTPDEALDEFRYSTGFGPALEDLPENPLPHVIIVEPTDVSEEALRALLVQLEQEFMVDFAQADLAWLRRLERLLNLGRVLVQILSGLFALGVMFVVANTVRVEVQARKDEVDVLSLAGATDAFIRRPFLYTGLWYGLCGGVLAWLMVQIGLWLLEPSVSKLAESYSTQLDILSVPFAEAALLVLGSSALGLIGAWLAVTRQLSAMRQLSATR